MVDGNAGGLDMVHLACNLVSSRVSVEDSVVADGFLFRKWRTDSG